MNSTALSVISISGSERHGPFGARDVGLLELLAPHLRRALQLHRRLVAADQSAGTLAGVVDRLARAVLLVDAGGHVTFMNQEASRLMAMRDGLTIDGGELRASRVSDTARLRSIPVDAVKTSSGAGFGAGGMFVVGRPSGRRPFVVLVSPVSRHRAVVPGVETAAAIVFVTDPEQVAVPDEDTLRTLFALTPAEARLTCLLAQEYSLVEAAARLGLQRETVRSRLKTIFHKTNTHSQPELVRLVLNGTPRV